MEEMKKRVIHTPTKQKFKRSLRQITGVEKVGSKYEGDDTDLDELDFGVRLAKLDKIDLRDIARENWFLRSDQGQETARISPGTADFLPEGVIRNNFLYPSEDVNVKVITDSRGNTSHILGLDYPTERVSVGSVGLVRGSTHIEAHPSGASIFTGTSSFSVGDDILLNTRNLYINNKKFTGVTLTLSVASLNSPDDAQNRADILLTGENDSQNIQTEIDKYYNKGEAIGLEFAPGNYFFDKALNLPNGFSIKGSRGLTKFNLLERVNDSIIKVTDELAQVNIVEIDFNGNKQNQIEKNNVIDIQDAHMILIDRCNINDASLNGIQINGHDINLNEVHIKSSNNNGLYIYESDVISVTNSKMEENGQQPSSIESTLGGIKLEKTHNAKITGTYSIKNNTNGFMSQSCNGVVFSNVTSLDNGFNGLLSIKDNFCKIMGSDFSNNGVMKQDPHRAGIYLSNGGYNNISNNNIISELGGTQTTGISLRKDYEDEPYPHKTIIKSNIVVNHDNPLTYYGSIENYDDNNISENIGVD